MVHRVYICSNLKSPFVVKQLDEIESCFKTIPITPIFSSSSLFVLSQQVQFQEREQRCIVSKTRTTTSTSIDDFELGTTQPRQGE